MVHRKPRRWLRWIVGILVVAAVLGFVAWYNFFRIVPGPAYEKTRDHFLYGSIGSEGVEGTPYWIWVILPKIFPEYLPGPGGYASLGMSYEQGKELPMGATKMKVGFDRVGINCSFCHVSQVKLTEDQPVPDLYPGGPSHQFRVQGYQSFLFNSASDPRFNSTVIMNAIDGVAKLSWWDRMLYRFILIPQTRDALLQQKEEFAWQASRPRHGPGRVDPFNPIKFRIFKDPEDHTIGNADIPSIWNQDEKAGQFLHWDGLAKDFFQVAVNSAIGDGARDKYLNAESLTRVEDYLMNLDPPPYPLEIDEAKATAGEALYRTYCADCHAPDGSKTFTILPIEEIGTDRHRMDEWNQDQVDQWQAMADRYKRKYGATWTLDTLSKQHGYKNMLLDGIWLRGPYLHNGSVPSLRDLLDAPEDRPKSFYRGNILYDGEKVGFVSDVAEGPGIKYFHYDTTLPGNGNGGHVYGVDLTDEEKDQIVEYMKKL